MVCSSIIDSSRRGHTETGEVILGPNDDPLSHQSEIQAADGVIGSLEESPQVSTIRFHLPSCRIEEGRTIVVVILLLPITVVVETLLGRSQELDELLPGLRSVAPPKHCQAVSTDVQTDGEQYVGLVEFPI